MARGTIVTGRMLNRQQWQKAKQAAAIVPAGRVRPTAKPSSQNPNAPAAELVPPDQWTGAVRTSANYAVFLARELLGVTLTVSVIRTPNNFLACYGAGSLDFNLSRLGERWFDQGAR